MIINGRSFRRDDLAARIFERGYVTADFRPTNWVQMEGVAKVARMLIDDGVDADLLRNLDWPEEAVRLATS